MAAEWNGPDTDALRVIEYDGAAPVAPFSRMLINAESTTSGLPIAALGGIEGPRIVRSVDAVEVNPAEKIARWCVEVAGEDGSSLTVRFFPGNNKQQILGTRRFDLADVHSALNEICAAVRQRDPAAAPRVLSIGYVLINAVAPIALGESAFLQLDRIREALTAAERVPDAPPPGCEDMAEVWAPFAGAPVEFTNMSMPQGSKICGSVICDNEVGSAPKLEISTAASVTLRGVNRLRQMALTRLVLADIFVRRRADVFGRLCAATAATQPMAVERLESAVALLAEMLRGADLEEMLPELCERVEGIFATTPSLRLEYGDKVARLIGECRKKIDA